MQEAAVLDRPAAEADERTEWVRPDFQEFCTPMEVTAYVGQR